MNNFIIFGTNTSVGKTIVSALLSFKFNYLKPIQTGTETDQNFIKRFGSKNIIKTIYSFPEPLSPNLAAARSRMITDSDLVQAIKANLGSSTIIETAGGVNTPVISGNLQSNVFRALSLPAILVGDHRLGGISATLSAYESLKLRGYDVPLLVLFRNEELNNEDTIKLNLDGISNTETVVKTIEMPPDKVDDIFTDTENLTNYFRRNQNSTNELVSVLESFNEEKEKRLKFLQSNGEKSVWWPFTQHDLVKSPMIIDSAFGSNLNIYKEELHGLTKDTFDACASWWTNGLGHGNVKLAKAAAYAAGRCIIMLIVDGHVIAPEALHEPMVSLAEKLVSTCGKSWAEKYVLSLI